MLEISLTYFQDAASGGGDRSITDYTAIPVDQFKWLIYLSALAFHGVIAVILTELMGRTYGKWWLWFTVAFFLPLIGAISILLYHSILSTSVTEARQQTFWERILFGAPVSLRRALAKEYSNAREVKLSDYKPYKNNNGARSPSNGADPEIESLLEAGKYGEARAVAWNLMEISREAQDKPNINRYQEYLEVIAERQSMDTGEEVPS